MRLHRFFMILAGLLVLVLPLGLAGCGSDGNPAGPSTDELAGFTVEDPLDGVLDATMGSTPADPGPRIDRLAELLGLTDEQKAAFAAAYAEFRAGIEALREQVRAGELTREAARVGADALRAAFEAELQVILTAEQYALLQEMRAGRDGHRPPPPNPIARWEAWLEEIGADEAQTAAVLAALETLHDGMEALRDQVKDGTLTPREARAQAQTLREAFEAQLAAILTADQLAALNELRPDCPHPGRGNPPGPPPGRGGR